MPDLDERCSRHFRFRDLIECGETWRRLSERAPFDNTPLHDETFDGLAAAARELLDPVRERFGAVTLTYAFASPRLTRHITGRIAPSLDQHAGRERNARGVEVCPRGGQAIDLMVPGVPADVLAEFLLAETPFDRLYFYGPDRPVHVSSSAHPKGAVVLMVPHGPRPVPRAIPQADFRELAGRVFPSIRRM
jgi:hypothetical protein